MMGRDMVRSFDVRRASGMAALLLGSTALAGLPAPAFAQEAETTAPAETAAAPQGQVIRAMRVVGNQRLEPQTILSYIRLRIGQEWSSAAADQALKDLYATELLASAQIRNEDGTVVIEVQENPVVNRIILEGNKRIKDDKILPEIKVSPRQIFTRSKVRADVARIIELYKRQGRFAATVEPKMVMLEQNRVDIVFEITEGAKSKVRQINIVGNETFSDSKLRGEMVTKQTGLTKIFSSSTSYDPDRMAFDQQKLRQFYLTQGYADFRVVSAVAELTPDKRDFIITYVVEEGDRYKFGDIAVDSQLREFDGEKLAANLPMKKGDWYNAKQVEDTIESLNETAGTFGYAFADVRPRYDRNKEDRTMGLTFVIAEAPRVYVESVDINGNTLTQDKVIRREFRIGEGDAFNSLQVKRSTNRIKSLGYFQDKFEIEQKPGSDPDRIRLEANVEEKPTGELQLSAGFSSIESFIFQASVRQRNFRGRGQTIGLSGSYSRYTKSVEASFTEPYLFDKNVSVGLDIYRRDYRSFRYLTSNRDRTYQQATTGFQLRAGLPVTEFLTAVARYTLNYDKISLDRSQFFFDLDGDGVETCEPILAGRYLCEAIGNRTSSIFGLSLIYDHVDNRIRPTRGLLASVSADYAGLGGSVKYGRIRGNAANYWPLGGGFVFSVQGEGGLIKSFDHSGDPAAGIDDVRLTDRFYLGEPQIRGFDIRGVGPRVIRYPYIDTNGDGVIGPDDGISDQRNQATDDALGGKYYYMARAELEIPLGAGAREMGLRPSVFIDAGSVWGIRDPDTLDTGPAGRFLPTRDADGNALYTQIDAASVVNDVCTASATSTVTSPTNPNTLECLPAGAIAGQNSAIGNNFAFREVFLGDTWKPRLAVGIGVNWNSPFGPFRIDFSKVLLKREGDDTKSFTFNVGTQF
ncbi:MAG: outer membrane protein assembly factor BamA [Novosphingobium sp.]|nr:outer membrane protein assembly factor BamA [Novosphingobium sp.]